MKLDGWDVFFILYAIGFIIYLIHYIKKKNHQNGSQGQYNLFASDVSQKANSHHKKYTTIDGPFGTKIHVDENGDYAGESMPGLFGDTIHVDADGNYAGTSSPGLFDGQTFHTDADGNYVGQSNQGLFGTTVHSGKNGETGVTSDGLFGSKVTDIDYHDDWQ